MKKQGVILSVCAILVFLVAGCAAPDSPAFTFNEKAIINERENGWYYFSLYSYEDTSNSGPSYYSAFVYNAYNLKYKHIDGYDIPIVDKDTGEVVDYAKTSLPYLSLNQDVTSDITNISSYFEGKRLGTSIDMSDLDGLELTYFNKQDFLEIVNNTLAQEPQPDGKYGALPEADIFQEDTPIDGYRWQIGYFCSHGNILAARIELLYEGDSYLSDLVADGKATPEQRQIYEASKQLETFILEKQSFLLEASPAQLHGVSFKRLAHLAGQIEETGSRER